MIRRRPLIAIATSSMAGSSRATNHRLTTRRSPALPQDPSEPPNQWIQHDPARSSLVAMCPICLASAR